MARPNRGDRLRTYFRELFAAQPHLLAERSNDAIIARFRVDHPRTVAGELPAAVQLALATTKSEMRRERRSLAAAAILPAAPADGLSALEELIDECLTLARLIDREGLAHIIELLRSARNEVVITIGH